MYPYVPLIFLLIGLVLFLEPHVPPKLAALGSIFVWLGLGFVLAQVVHAVPVSLPR